MSDYTVSEISARSPDMSDADFSAFVDDIRTNGQLVPIWIHDGEVIDGRKRLAACGQLGIAPKVVNLSPDQDAESISRALNVLRTHYTSSQRAMFAARRANLSNGQRPDYQVGKNPLLPVSNEAAAREVGVDRTMVIKAKRVEREGAPDVAEAVKRGKLTLHAAAQIVDAVPKDEQPAAVAKVIEASRGKARHTPVAKVLEQQGDPRKDRAQPKPAHEQFARAVQMLDVASELIAEHAEAASSDARRKEFLETLCHVRTTLTRCINTLEIAA